MNIIDDYGLGGMSPIDVLFTPEEQLEMERRRLRGAQIQPVQQNDYNVPSLDELLASTAASTAPTGINPAAPASSQPPAVTNPVGSIAPTVITTSSPNKYERRQGVTLDDRLQSLAMTMSAVGTPQFANVYATANQLLASKQAEADTYNMALDEGTKPTIDVLSNGTTVTRAAKYIRNSDNTYSINPKAGSIISTGSTTPGLEGLTPEQRAAIDGLTGDNADTMKGYFLGQNSGLVPKDMSYEEFVVSPLNANQGETSKSFNRNQNAFEMAGYEPRDAFQLASLADRGNLVMKFDDKTGEIIYADPTTGKMETIRSVEEGVAKIGKAIQSEEDIKRGSSLTRTAEELAQQRRSEQIKATGAMLEEKLETFRIGQDQLDRSREALKLLDDPTTETGMVNRLILDYLGVAEENMARLSTMSKTQIIEAVKGPDVTLTPVSDPDIRMLEALWGDVGKNPATMRAQISQFIKEKERELKGIQRNVDTNLLGFSGVDWENQNPEGYLNNWRRNYAPIFNWKTFDEIQAEIDAARQ